MMRRVVVGLISLAVTVGCAGGSGDDGSAAGPESVPVSAASTVVTTEPLETRDEVVRDDATPPPPDTDPVETVDAPADTTPDRPLEINGPAEVAEGSSADAPDDAPSGSDVESTDCSAVPRGVSEFVLEAGGGPHDVRVFVPETLLAEPAPVVLDWHGLGSNGPEQAAYSGYEDLAAAEGFVTVHATGLPLPPSGGASWELVQFDSPERDDLAFADALIDAMVADWCGDPARIYSTGMSNGGFFTAELVCNRADRIAAAVSVAGLSHAPSCAPSRPVPYIAFHGTDDDIVPFDGDGESVLVGSTFDATGFFEQVMPDEFAEFAASAGCDPEPVRNDVTAEVVRFDYTGCDDDVPMSFYELPGSGHTWPDTPLAPVIGDALGVITSDVSATVDGWAFLSQHSL